MSFFYLLRALREIYKIAEKQLDTLEMVFTSDHKLLLIFLFSGYKYIFIYFEGKKSGFGISNFGFSCYLKIKVIALQEV